MEGFNERIARMRKARGMGQHDLADAIGVSVDSVRRWEWGKQEPRLSDLLRLADVLGASVEELATGRASDGKITIRHGGMELDIPATPEGFAFVEGKMREMAAADQASRGASLTHDAAV